MPTKLILWIIILGVGIGLIFFAQVFRDKPNDTSLRPAPSESPNPTASPTQSPTPGGSISKTATCQISGQVRFISSNTYETVGAKISYQNVDDKIRQIFWTSNPDDGVLAVGPNLFEQLQIPNGEKEVGVALNKKPQADNYVLTAAINYGVKLPSGAEELKKINCTGTITVDTSKAK